MPIYRRMNEEGVVHIYNGIFLIYTKGWNNAICSNMDGPRDYHTKWSKSDKETPISYVVRSKKMIQMYLQNRQIHRHRKETYAYPRWGGERVN